MPSTTLEADVVELPATDGVAFVEQSSPLTRLHYFDGQFLRAASLTTEQDYHRHALQLANVAGGWGAVHGFGIALAGDSLNVSPGLGVTPNGQLVLAGSDMKAKLADLLSAAKPPSPSGKAQFDACLEAKAPTATASVGLQVYEITVGPIEGLCGNEAVFGKLCETACASDSRRPYWREGVVLRLRPVNLDLRQSASVPATTAHMRNRVASAYFAREPGQPPSLLSAAGLASGVWCERAQLYHRDELVIGLLWRDAGVARIDAWAGRRERMDTQPRAYWQGRMAMRPWNIYTAQILQFQCQLSGLFDANSPVLTPADDCDRIREALGDARHEIEALLKRFEASSKGLAFKSGGRESVKRLEAVSAAYKSSYADLAGLSGKLAGIGVGGTALPRQRMLINAGFFELPPAGYLPVSPGSDVRPQCERMFGEGVALHFHAVRPDEIAHLVEEAEHLDRISLTRGLDDPARVEQVEVFVPEGRSSLSPAKSPGEWWAVRLDLEALELLEVFDVAHSPPSQAKPVPAEAAPAPPGLTGMKSRAAARLVRADAVAPWLDGLGRTEGRDDGSCGFTVVFGADAFPLPNQAGDGETGIRFDVLSGDIDQDPFALVMGASTPFSLGYASARGSNGFAFEAQGRLTVLRQRTSADGAQELLVQLDFQASQQRFVDGQAGAAGIGAGRQRLVLQREGDSRAGVFTVAGDPQNRDGSHYLFEWFSAPRRARQSIEARAFDADGTPGNLTRTQLMDMAALPGVPGLGDDIAATALSRLATIAENVLRPDLLLRIRRRLLPTLDAPKGEVITTAADWVMFRRARTHLCGPACTTAATTTLETFQVWHLELDSDKQLAVVRKAIDGGDAKALAEFEFTRVGLLRYRDESAFSEESDTQVLAMWRAAQPAARVALGRIWEIAPTTGQGWQNHMRLRHMVETIDSVTKPPPVGDGSLAVSAPPPGELGDKATDGGVLLVTLGAEVKTHNHRVVMLPFGMYADLVPMFRQSAKDALDDLARFLGDPAVTARDKDAHFSQGQLAGADATALQDAHEEMRRATHDGINVQVHQFLVSLKPIDADVQPAPEHETIAKLLKLDTSPAPNGPNDGATVTSDVNDLGRGTQVLTLLGYEDRS